MKNKAGFIIKEIHRRAWESLSDELCGKLLKILISYQFDNKLPTGISTDLQVALSFLIPVVDKQKTDYEKTCNKRSKAANKRWGNDV